MATRRYKVNPGEGEFNVVEEAGAANNSDLVELTIDLVSTGVNIENSATRTISKEEALQAIDKIKNHIIKSNWPPA